jgi:heme o synthase
MTSSTAVATAPISGGKVRAYIELLKFRLSFLVAFSGAFGYLLGIEHFSWQRFLLFTIAGFSLTGASNIINQIIEKDYDKLMKRTQNRPLPTGRLNNAEAYIWSGFLLIISLSILFFEFNINTGLVGLLSYILYSFVYTPLKRVGPIAVLIGAIPGAFPPMIGWLAATGQFGLEPGILFAIQFFWQLPHFFAIAWVAHEDYSRAGFRLLPNNGSKDLNTAIQMMIYTLFLVPLSFVPYELGMTGINSAIITMICGVLFLAQTFNLMRKCTDKAALQIMFGSFLYLPIVQIAFLLDKI